MDASGCPAPQITDSDGDGVADSLDRCPDTPPKTPVNLSGCPIDADGDGVADLLDKCPATPAGTPVDAQGCPAAAPAEKAAVKEETLALNLEFLPGKAELRPEFEPQLQEAVRFIQSHPGERILVEGHTDSVGPADANLRLSQARAERVRRYLLEKTSISPELIQARGYGETQPVGDNASQVGRAQNRRVVIRLADGQ